MEPFLLRLARLLLERHGSDLQRVAVVLPSKRAGLTLRRYLASVHGKALWSPAIHDVGSFLSEMARMRQGDTMELLFLMHRVHAELMGEAMEPLDEFIQWAPTSLRDMSEVDAHALDLEKVYRDLRSYHEIEEWSFRLEELSPSQRRTDQHWRTTGRLHHALHAHMRQHGVGTSGAVARMAMERVLAGELPGTWDHVWFAGLNAVEPAFTKVIQSLQQRGLASVAWDADHHYLDDTAQEAGSYLRRSMEALGKGQLPPCNELRTRTRTVQVDRVPNGAALAIHAGALLAGLSPAERERTAIVLADESLLMPLLSALPVDAGALNITMGLPLHALPIHGCTEAFLHIHTEAQRHGNVLRSDVEALLLHPFLHRGMRSSKAVEHLRSTGEHRIASEDLPARLHASGVDLPAQAVEALRPVAHAQREMPERWQAFLAWLREASGTDAFRTEQVFQMARLQQRLEKGLADAPEPVVSLETYATLRQRLLREERIAFFGEPLQGAQVMGYLETRAIDHERIILLGTSEGTLPRGAPLQTWIPHDIRRTYGLPMRHDADAISAYLFYRMMQQASHAVLAFGDGEGPGCGEPSRFLLQWKHELPTQPPTVWSERTLMAPFAERTSPEVAVHKSGHVIERLTQRCAKGLSPSLLAGWLRCPLDIYFTRVLGIKEAEEADGRLGSNILGEAVHGVLEDLFRPWTGTVLDPAALRNAAAKAPPLLNQRLSMGIPEQVLRNGHHRLRMEMASTALERYLHAEADLCAQNTITPLALELDLQAELRPGVRIIGRADRIDLRNGIHHVLDLKTGSVKQEQLRLSSLDRALLTADKAYALQLLTYAWMYLHAHPEIPAVRAGIIPLQKASAHEGLMLQVEGSNDIHREQLPAIGALLEALVDEMLDPAVPMKHHPDSLYCTACLV